MLSIPITKDHFVCKILTKAEVCYLPEFNLKKKHLKKGAAGVLKYLRLVDAYGTYWGSQALVDNKNNSSKTYLVFNNKAKKCKLCAFFTLKPGLVPFQTNGNDFETTAAIELVNFAVNANYKSKLKKQIGAMTFADFIMPLVKEVQQIVGAQILYIYALPIPKLIQNYKNNYLFNQLTTAEEAFVHSHVKPEYDKKCQFMYMHI